MKNGRFIPLLFLLLAVLSCQRDGLDLTLTVGPYGKETRKVMLLYEAGFNSLGGDISRKAICPGTAGTTISCWYSAM